MKNLKQINDFLKLASEKFKDDEKIQYAIKVRFTHQIEKVQEKINVMREPYEDSLILKGLVHEDGDKKGSLKRDENGKVLYSPQVEVELKNELKETQASIVSYLFEIDTYLLESKNKPSDFTEEDQEIFDGFIEFSED
jgi:hypothetical protein